MSDNKFHLHVNHEPISPAGFDARVSRCIAELSPVIERLCNRHGVAVVYAALLSECGDATLARAMHMHMSPAILDRIEQRLMRAIEDAKRVGPPTP